MLPFASAEAPESQSQLMTQGCTQQQIPGRAETFHSHHDWGHEYMTRGAKAHHCVNQSTTQGVQTAAWKIALCL